jgi:hypothetical protein
MSLINRRGGRSLSFASLAAFGAAFAFASFVSTSAHADEAAAAPAPLASAPADRTLTAPEPPQFKQWAVEVNPLAAAIGRYSLQAEWLPAKHHAIVLNPHFDHTTADVTVGPLSYSESFTGFGAEVGYRFYTGEQGANGFFIGPSLIAAHYGTSVGDKSGDSFNSIGAAVDLGGQVLVGPGILIGAGVGMQYSSVSINGSTDGMPLSAQIIAGGGVRPRALLTLGYAF